MMERPNAPGWCAGALFPSAPATRRAAPGGPPAALLIFGAKSGDFASGRDTRIAGMAIKELPVKISIELDGFALRVLTAILLSAWAAFGGGSEVVSGAVSLYLILKG